MFKRHIKMITLASVLTIMMSVPAFSETFQGTIEGADCFINKMHCAESETDPHLDMEKSFVLVTNGGIYYFLPNLFNSVKKECYRKRVKVSGRNTGNAIHVSRLEVEADGGYTCIWDWDKIQEERYGGGR